MHRFSMREGKVNRVTWHLVPVLMFALALGHTPARAQETKAATSTIDEKAMATLMAMAEFLAKTQQVGFTVDIGYDVMQDWGQKLEFGATRKIVVRRPDRMAVDITDRDGTRRGFRFDGKQIAFFGMDEKVYATAQKSGDIDAAMAYFTDNLQMPLPLADLLTNNLPKTLKGKVSEAYLVEETTLNGTPGIHLAVRNDLVDAQLWIAKGDKPVPQRVVLTYKLEDGEPQFWANFRDWNFSPETSDSLFTFTPAEGAARIAFVAGMDPDAGMKEQKQGAQP
jgi:hypothetical protein